MASIERNIEQAAYSEYLAEKAGMTALQMHQSALAYEDIKQEWQAFYATPEGQRPFASPEEMIVVLEESAVAQMVPREQARNLCYNAELEVLLGVE